MVLTGCASQQVLNPIAWDAKQRLPTMDQKPHIGVAGPIVGLLDGKLLIAGGANFPDKMPWDGGKKQYQQLAYLFAVNAGKLDLKMAFHLDEYSAYAANVSAAGKIFTAGGENAAGPSSFVRAYTLDTTGVLEKEVLPSLPQPLTNGSMVYWDNHLYFIGGENAQLVSNKIYKLDLQAAESTWDLFLELPYALSHTVTACTQKGQLLIAGGRKSNPASISDIYDRVLSIDVATKKISDIAKLPEPLAAATGLLSPQGDLLIFGGDNGSTFHQVETLIAAISATKDDAEKQTLTAQKNKLQQQHPGFTSNVWRLDLQHNRWVKDSPIIGLSPVTTTAVRMGNYIFIPSGEVKAGLRTDQLLVGELKSNP